MTIRAPPLGFAVRPELRPPSRQPFVDRDSLQDAIDVVFVRAPVAILRWIYIADRSWPITIGFMQTLSNMYHKYRL